MPAQQQPAGVAPVATAPWQGGRWRRFATPDRRLLALSIGLQLVLAALLGHSYDTKVFLATGYLAGGGHDPYVAQNVIGVFHHTGFSVIDSVGYPPPWPLALGLLYLAAWAPFHSLVLYAVAIKLPVIAAGVGLAYLTAAWLQNLGVPAERCRRAWIFVLFNPFLLFVGAAWGQIDAIVALLALAALALLVSGRRSASALALALAVCVKPTAAPILLVALAYLAVRSGRRALVYGGTFVAGVFVFYVLPFLALGWSAAPLKHTNAEFTASGGMSLMTVARVFHDPLILRGHWWLLGLAWVVALAVAALALRRGVGDADDLVSKSAALVLVFFLTRTWLSEPNAVLLLPLVLILTTRGRLDGRALTVVWVVPLLYAVANAAPLQTLWLLFPGAMQRSLDWIANYGHVTLLARAALVLVWETAGWWIVVACLRRRPARAAALEAVAA